MMALLEQFAGLEKVFFACAVAGTLLFAVRLLLQFLGSGAIHHDVGSAVDVAHTDVSTTDTGDGSGHDTYLSFKLLSFQGLTAFFMMFGWVGLAMMRQSGQGPLASVAAAMVAGLVTVWIISWMFHKAGSLQTSGNIDVRNAVGHEAEIYLTIPAAGIGKAQVTIQERLRIYNAVSRDQSEIKTGQRVRVTEVTPQDVLVVERIG
jgi:hypothetical protein